MQLRLDHIGPEGLELDEPVELDWLGEVFSGRFPNPFKPVCASRLTGRVLRVGSDLVIDLRCPLRIVTECGSCLKPFEMSLEIAFQMNLKPAPSGGDSALPPEQELQAVDLDEATYSGEVLDLGGLLREQIILALPMAPRCTPDCRGLCQRCGADLNSGDCDCQAGEIDPRLAVLKAFKVVR